MFVDVCTYFVQILEKLEAFVHFVKRQVYTVLTGNTVRSPM